MYLDNFFRLIDHVYDVALGPGTRRNSQAVERELAAVIGPGEITATMLGRYLKKQLTSEAEPKTHLGLAQFLRAKSADPRWGKTDQDALTAVYDWLEYGPTGAPPKAPPDRHANRPTAEKIKSDRSTLVRGIEQAIPQMSPLEIVSAIESLSTALRFHLEGGVEADEEPEIPAPPCDENNAVTLVLGLKLGLPSPLTTEAIALVADKAHLDAGRARAILCGAQPTDDEFDLLAAATGLPVDRFRILVQSYVAIKEAESKG